MWDPQSGNFSPCRIQHKKQAVGSSQLCVVTEWDITLDLAGTQDTFLEEVNSILGTPARWH